MFRGIHDCALEVGDGMVWEMMSLRVPAPWDGFMGKLRLPIVVACRKSLCEELIRSKTRMRPNFRVLNVEQLRA